MEKNGKESSPPTNKPTKSYDNTEWLHSRAARHVRIMCEYLEVQDRLRHQQIMCTILVFGSARCMNREQWEQKKADLLRRKATAKTAKEIEEVKNELIRLDRLEWMCEYWDKTYQLCKLLMTWVQTPEARFTIAKILREVPSPAAGSTDTYAAADCELAEDLNMSHPLALCTGGGPGLMEAANKGASDVPGARSMGMGISLPFELGLNKYVQKELSFEFHYFFSRKFWMVYLALGLIATPGGVGTMDELMEFLTLKQSGKFKREIPIVLFGKKYWQSVINFDKMVEYGTIGEEDRNQLFYTDCPEEAFEYIKNHLLADKCVLGSSHVHKSIRALTQNKTNTIAAGGIGKA